MGKKKVPRGAAKKGRTEKRPRVESLPEENHKLTPVWTIETLQQNGPFGWSIIDGSFLWDDIIPKLQNFESMNWGSILGGNNHEVPVSGISREAQRELIRLRLDDIERIVSLRLTGTQRIWGIKIGRVFSLLWWDPKHEVCPSSKKNT